MSMTTASVPRSASLGRSASRATVAWILGLVVAVVLGIATMALGVALWSYDQRRHIPGHFLYTALFAAPGLVQVLYVVPLCRAALRRGHRGFGWGLWVGASFVALANGALVWMDHVLSQMD